MKAIPYVFHIWKLQIHTYGIGLAITFWLAFRYFERRVRRAGFPTGWITGMFIWTVIAAIVGARALHVATTWGYYSRNPGDILTVWHGGLSSFGGLLFAIPVGLVLARRGCPSLNPWRAMDLVAPVLMAGWAMGRMLGPQLMYQGGGHMTTAWYGIEYWGQAGKRVPVPIFQAFDSFVIWIVLLQIEKRLKRTPDGLLLAAAAGLWGLARWLEEWLWLAGGSTSDTSLGQHLVEGAGLALFVGGAAAMTAILIRDRSRQAAVSLPEQPEGAEDAARAGHDGDGAGSESEGESAEDKEPSLVRRPAATEAHSSDI